MLPLKLQVKKDDENDENLCPDGVSNLSSTAEVR